MNNMNSIFYLAPMIDEWVPNPIDENKDPLSQDQIFFQVQDKIIAPMSYVLFKTHDPLGANKFDYFGVKLKNCYNSVNMRQHIVHYLNYFERYFDIDHEYLSIISMIKKMIDDPNIIYSQDNFINDIERYLYSESMIIKVRSLVQSNYRLSINYAKVKKTALCYDDRHVKLLLLSSFLTIMTIPIAIHFAESSGIDKHEIDTFILRYETTLLDIIDEVFNIQLSNKLYETCRYNIQENISKNKILWDKQPIRGITAATHCDFNLNNILVNIMPKYTFSDNPINLNLVSVKNSNKYKVTGTQYEYTLFGVKSSEKDQNSNSQWDQFEAQMIKKDELAYMNNKVNCSYAMDEIRNIYSATDEEIAYQLERLGDNPMVNIQKNIIFNLSYKYFQNTMSINSINIKNYIEIMLAMKRLLLKENLKVLPYVISGKFIKIANRTSLNKADALSIQNSKNYGDVLERYKGNTKIIDGLISQIATICLSEIEVIDYYNKSIDKLIITNNYSSIIIEEMLMVAKLV